LSPKALEIAKAVEKLDDSGKKAALDVVIGLELTHPLGRSGSINIELFTLFSTCRIILSRQGEEKLIGVVLNAITAFLDKGRYIKRV
jgi:hypothetical protein